MKFGDWFKKIHRYIYFGSVGLFFFPYWPILKIWAQHPDKNYSKLASARNAIAKRSAHFAGFSFDIKEVEPIDWSKQYILCPNHTSNLDITALMVACPQEFSFIGKVELLKNPVTGLFFRSIDIPVNRSSKISSFKAFKRAEEYIEQGKSIVIFPEGKIGDHYPPELCPFKSGPFRISADKNIGILPVVIHNAWELHWDDGKLHGSTPGTIRVEIFPPVFAENTSSEAVDKLQESVYNTINSNWIRPGINTETVVLA